MAELSEQDQEHMVYLYDWAGQPWKAQSWFLSHEEIADGAVIDFYMSEEPSDR